MAIIRLQGEEEKRRGIHYEIDASLEPIGVGGMGQVFKGTCVDESTGATRPVAIKFMYEDLPPQAVERARREASVQLRNDNLVEMLGFIEIEEANAQGETKKHYHVVSELLDGVSLSDILEGKTKGRDGEDVPYAVKLLQDYRNDPEHFAKVVVKSILSGLMALHDAGYIHRDIDPSNIMVTKEGNIKLIDFGIAKQMNTLTTSDKALTVAGKFMGKPEYAAPELAMGDISHQNQTTDIYAMGILLYQCIVGHTPFEGARHEILEKQMREKLPLNVIKNKHLRSIIETACQKKQALRYQSTAQMRVALDMESAPSKLNIKYIIAACIAVGVVLLVAGIVMMSGGSNEEPKPAEKTIQRKNTVAGKVLQQAIDSYKEDSTAQSSAAKEKEAKPAKEDKAVEAKEKADAAAAAAAEKAKQAEQQAKAAAAQREPPAAVQKQETATLVVLPTSMTFKKKGKAKDGTTITVNCNQNWTYSCSGSWCHVTRNGKDLTVSVDDNDTGADRSCSIVIRCGKLQQSVTISQNGKKELF